MTTVTGVSAESEGHKAESADGHIQPGPSEQATLQLFSIASYGVFYEAQLIWARFNVMLAIQSVSVGAMAILFKDASQDRLNRLIIVGIALMALLLAWIWRQITIVGWKIEEKFMDYARKALDEPLKNPWKSYDEAVKDPRDPKVSRSGWLSQRYGMWVIYVFMTVDAIAFVGELVYFFWSV